MAHSIIGEFFEENYHQFKRYLRSRFNELNEYDAEDIIQQTIMKLLYKGDDFLSINNLSSYVYTSLQNNARDHFKKSNRIELHGEYTVEMEAGARTVEEEILLKELKAYLKQAIFSLDEDARYIFIETEIKGRSYKDIVDETGIKLGTWLSRKSRAKQKLREALQHYIGGHYE